MDNSGTGYKTGRRRVGVEANLNQIVLVYATLGNDTDSAEGEVECPAIAPRTPLADGSRGVLDGPHERKPPVLSLIRGAAHWLHETSPKGRGNDQVIVDDEPQGSGAHDRPLHCGARSDQQYNLSYAEVNSL